MMYDVSPRMCCYGNNPHVEGECQVWISLTYVEFFIRVPWSSTLGGAKAFMTDTESTSIRAGDVADLTSSMISLKFLIEMAEDFCASLSSATNSAISWIHATVSRVAHVQGHRQIMTKE